jgi:hypothetical protein
MQQCGALVASDEARQTLIGLLRRQGVRCREGDLVIKTVETRRGHPLHIVFALNGTEQALRRLIARVACRRNATIGPLGVFFLRPDDLQQLVRKAASH